MNLLDNAIASIAALTARAEKAESDLAAAQARIAELEAAIARSDNWALKYAEMSDKVEAMEAENARLRAALDESEDAELIGWLESQPDLTVRGYWEGDEDEQTLWWYVMRKRRSLTHPYGTWREAVRAAIARAKEAPRP